MHFSEVIAELHSMADPAAVRGLSRFGLPTENALGISAPNLRALAKRIGRDQGLSLKLWATGVHEARVLAALVGEPDQVSKRQMARWARDFDSWGVCDACCAVLFVYTPHAMEMAFKWSRDKREYVKRAGFVLMASMAVHQKSLADNKFVPMLRAIREQSADERGFVKKAVNWALRQIGKRNLHLNSLAIETAIEIHSLKSPAARWVASDALRELRSDAVQRRLKAKLARRNSR
ncbi:MAG: DNA alkylation repair protein [Ignavibacteriales bacterium]|nr:DNA alkylation repair protein [Ignavibacteriales bacterium]